ncbi:TPA: restriction endonuclease subunit S [Streptococcus suis]
MPYDIPESWEWVRLNEIASYIQRGKSPRYSSIPKYPVIAQKCNQWSGFSIELAKFISPDTVKSYQEERLLRQGDLMWNSTGLGTLGRIAIYDEDKNPYGWAVADSHITVIRLLMDFIDYRFIFKFLSSPIVQSVIEEQASGSTKQKELSTATVKNYLIPLPPLAEQKRIVAQIERALEKVEVYAESYNKLQELDKAFPDKLKKSILQYAMQGKLVAQDPNDEPVEVLLEKIRAEKQKLYEEGKLKKKDLAEIVVEKGDDNSPYQDVPYDIPKSWKWVRLNEIASYIQRGKSPRYSSIPKYPVIAQKCNQWSGFSIELAKFISPDTVKSYQEERLLRQGDLMWNSTGLGTLGRIVIYDEDKNPYGWAVADSHITVIRLLMDFIDYHFIFKFLSSPIVQSVIEEQASGSTKQKELSTATVKNYLIPLPPLAEQKRIVSKISKIFSVIETLV